MWAYALNIPFYKIKVANRQHLSFSELRLLNILFHLIYFYGEHALEVWAESFFGINFHENVEK